MYWKYIFCSVLPSRGDGAFAESKPAVAAGCRLGVLARLQNRSRSLVGLTDRDTVEIIAVDTGAGEVVRVVPARPRLPAWLRIAYCCGCQKPLAKVFRTQGLLSATVVAIVSLLDGEHFGPGAMSLPALRHHLECPFHADMREGLRRLALVTWQPIVMMASRW